MNFLSNSPIKKPSLKETSLKVNIAGRKAIPNFEFVRVLPGLNKDRKRMIEVRNVETGELAKSPYTYLVTKNRNPFKKHKYSDSEVKNITNHIGLKSNPSFHYYGMTNKINNNGSRIIEVQNSITKEIKEITFTAVKRGTNPWREKQDRFEETIVHPKIKEALTNLGIEIYQYETFLLPYVKPDFVLKNQKGNILFLDAKTLRSKRKVTKKSIEDQLKKYNAFGISKYGDNFLGTLFISPDGTNHCSSLNDLESKLKEYNFL